jgi:uncharacterized SAM-binding protein YcdF (DUF218 family)
MLALLTRVLLWASVGLLIWYVLTKIIDKKYLTWFGGVILILLMVISFVDPTDDTISIIWRILSFPLTPLGAAVVFLGLSLSEGTKAAKGAFVSIALAILLIFSIPLSAQWVVSQAEQSVTNAYRERSEICGEVCRSDDLPESGLGEASAVVVLGDSSDISRQLDVFGSPEAVSVNTTLAPRLIYAANLYSQARDRNASPVVVVTAGDGDANSDQNQVIRNILVNNGVFGEDIIIKDTGLDVYRAAKEVEQLLQQRGVIRARDLRETEGIQGDPRIFLVAPAITMSRAALTFEKFWLQVVARPTDFYSGIFKSPVQDPLIRLPDLFPSADALQLTSRYWNELLTSLYYFLRGWLPDFNFGWNSSIEI